MPDAIAASLRSDVPSATWAGRASAFGAIDDLVSDPNAAGVVFVRGTRASLGALGRHVERRVRATGRPVVRLGAEACDEPWRELAARLGAPDVASPHVAACAIA